MTIKQFGYGCCPIAEEIRTGQSKCHKCGTCFRGNKLAENGLAQKAYDFARSIIKQGAVQLFVLDKISHAIRHKLLAVESVLLFLAECPAGIEVILTGQNMPDSLISIADEASCYVAVKHPFAASISARRGIEY